MKILNTQNFTIKLPPKTFKVIYLLFLLFITLWTSYQLRKFAYIPDKFEISFNELGQIQVLRILIFSFDCKLVNTCFYDILFYLGGLIILEIFILKKVLELKSSLKRKFKKGIQAQLLVIHVLVGIALSVYITTYLLIHNANSQISKTKSLFQSEETMTSMSIIAVPSEIKAKLLELNQPPTILDYDDNYYANLLMIISGGKISGKGSFYSAVLLPSESKKVAKTDDLRNSKNLDLLLLSNNILASKRMDEETQELLLPIISDMMIKDATEDIYKGKELPIINVMSRDEYTDFRKRQEENKKKAIEMQLAYVRNQVNEIYSAINQARQTIDNLEFQYSSQISRINNWYSTCIIYLGFDQYCISGKSELLNEAKSLLDTKAEYASALSQLQAVLPEWENALELWEQVYTDFITNPADPLAEYGKFDPPDKVSIAIIDESITTAIATALHETLHYQTYSDKNSLPRFFEESMTEFFAYSIATKYMINKKPPLGYPVPVAVMSRILDAEHKDDWKHIYLYKDEKQLERTIDEKYKKGTYEKLKEQSDLLMTVSDDSLAQKSALNIIGNLIGEPELNLRKFDITN